MTCPTKRPRQAAPAAPARRAEHPWTRPALRSPDAAVQARVTALYEALRQLLTEAHGEPCSATLTALASAADQFEALTSVKGEDPKSAKLRAMLARSALDGVQHARRAAKLMAQHRRRS